MQDGPGCPAARPYGSGPGVRQGATQCDGGGAHAAGAFEAHTLVCQIRTACMWFREHLVYAKAPRSATGEVLLLQVRLRHTHTLLCQTWRACMWFREHLVYAKAPRSATGVVLMLQVRLRHTRYCVKPGERACGLGSI